MEWLGDVLAIFGIVMLASAFVEALALRFVLKRRYDWRSSLASFATLLGRGVTDLVPLAIAMPGAYWLYEHRVFEPGQLGVGSFFLLFLGLEFVYYWWHRISHRSRWFWTHHAVHHSPNDFNLSAAYRLGWTSRIMGTYVIFAPLAWIGYEPTIIFLAYSLNLAYQFWIHAEWIPRLGPLEGILNTASAHRVHHAANVEYLDSNFGGVLVVFDRLFGTYRPERDDVEIRFGLVKPLESYNPLRIAFHQFAPLLRDLSKARSLREVIGYLFGPPGWRPDGNGETTEDLRRRIALSSRDEAEPAGTSVYSSQTFSN
jgi:sterol desaturase/sphingolipid hydroxylase (fatty acid hydroxylase superfamily)